MFNWSFVTASKTVPPWFAVGSSKSHAAFTVPIATAAVSAAAMAAITLFDGSPRGRTGALLRQGLLPRVAVGILYVAVGSGLLVASRRLWAAWWNDRRRAQSGE